MTAFARKAISERDRKRVYRAGGTWTTGWIGGTLAGAYEAYAVVVIIQAGQGLLAAAMVAGLMPLWIVAVRWARMCAVATERGLHVRNFRRTTFVPWNEIDGFTVGARGILPKVGIVERRDGEQIPITGIQGFNPVTCPKNRSAERVIECLNHELREHRSALEARSRDSDPRHRR